MSNLLPDLPLMLADVPRPVVELLRAIGLPAEPLPRMALLAEGVGRFVLFDSRSRRSVAQMQRARSQGLKTIDLADFPLSADELDALHPAGESAGAVLERTARLKSFVDHLKNELEFRGGVWVRVADYPFPYQSALCIGIEHLSDELSEFTDITSAMSPGVTHFLSSRLRADRLVEVATGQAGDVGWHVREEDIELSNRRTISHWRTRADRFRAAGVDATGLSLRCKESAAPARSSLMSLGFCYSCAPRPCSSCAMEAPARSSSEAEWVSFGAVPLPAHDDLLEWTAAHYQAGCPLFIVEPTSHLDLVQELACLSGDAARCSLLWRTNFARFAGWWHTRRTVRLQVWRRDDHCEVHAAGEFGDYRWAIEIWRGNHVATLPLVQTEMQIPDEGLVYLTSPRKSLGGCTIPHESVLELVGVRSGRHRAA